MLAKNELLHNKTDEFQTILNYQNDLHKNKKKPHLKPIDYVSDQNNRLNELQFAKKHIHAQHHDSDGYITLFQKFKDNSVFQWNYQPEELLSELHKWVGQNDVYFSQNTFFIPKRITSYVRHLRAFYTDLDFYNTEYSREEVLQGVQALIDKGEIPQYNLIINSGRGIVLVWFIKHAPKQLVSLWATIQVFLNDKLEEFGADANAMDIARVFRLSGSYNSKSNKMVTFEVVNDTIHYMGDIHKKYLPKLKLNYKPKKGRKSKVQHLYSLYSLNVERRQDLTRLLKNRDFDLNKNSVNGKGCREFFFFLYRYWSMFLVPNEDDILVEMRNLNSRLKEPLTEEELTKATKRAEQAYKDHQDDKKNEIARKMGYPAAGYNYKNTTLITKLQITEAEQRQLKTIIDKKIKQERNTKATREKRRADGVKPREEYLKTFKDNKINGITLKERGYTYKEIADELNVNLNTVKGWFRKKK